MRGGSGVDGRTGFQFKRRELLDGRCLHGFRFVFVEHETNFLGAIPLTRKRNPYRIALTIGKRGATRNPLRVLA